MSSDKNQSDQIALLEEVRASAEELLLRACSPGIQESGLFPYGINRLAVHVKAGEAEITLELSGPDHGHESDEDWEEDLFDEADDEE